MTAAAIREDEVWVVRRHHTTTANCRGRIILLMVVLVWLEVAAHRGNLLWRHALKVDPREYTVLRLYYSSKRCQHRTAAFSSLICYLICISSLSNRSLH